MSGLKTSNRPHALALLGGSGKLAFATLTSILSHKLYSPSQIVATTSATSTSAPQWQKLAQTGVIVRHATFDDAASITTALQDVEKVFIVSSPRIHMDFYDAPPGQGREKDHVLAIEAARKAGVGHIYYTSLAYGRPSKASVMRAHIRTEEHLEQHVKDTKWTVIREGLYNESWPLYLGHWQLGKDDRTELPVAGDGKFSWTSIPDLGLANALVLAAPSEEYASKTLYLSNTREALSLEDVAGLIGKALGRDIKLKITNKDDYDAYYINERGMDKGFVEWSSDNYDAMVAGECLVKDTTFEKLLRSKNVEPKPMAQTVKEMLGV